MISVVIATKDRARDIERAIASLEGQTGAPPFELVVVDNGSHDETPAVLEAAHARAAMAMTIVREPNPNRAAARNRGIAATRYPLVLFVDDDVWLPPKFLAAHLQAHRDIFWRVVTGPIVNIPVAEARPRPSAANYSNAFFCTCNASVPRAALAAVGGFDESFDLYGWEDTDLGMRLRAHDVGRRFAWDAFLYHIKPPSNDTLDVALRRHLEKARMAAKFVRKFPTTRARLAAGAYAANGVRARVMTPRWSLPLWAAAATELPAPVAGIARARLLDGMYVDTLFRELAQ